MHFVLILIAALTVFAQAAPQFNSFNSRDWRSTGTLRQDQGQADDGNHNKKNDVTRQGFTLQSTSTGHRHSNDYGRQTHQTYQGSGGQCWDPVDQIYRDWPSQRQLTQQSAQFSNDNFPVQSNYNPSMYPNPYSADQYRGPRSGRPEPPHHHREHGPPQYHHHHHNHHHHHHHGPPPGHHGYGYPPNHHQYGHPPHYHQHGPPPLPPRPPRPPQNGNEYELEICEDTTNESNVFDNTATSTAGNLDVSDIPISLPVSNSSLKPEITTESTSGKLVESTTQFDWNNYFPEENHGTENIDGIGLIDVRLGGVNESPN